jgi:hypothetical protein
MAKVLWGINISLAKDASISPIQIDTHPGSASIQSRHYP